MNHQVCLSCSMAKADAVEPTELCRQREHATIARQAWLKMQDVPQTSGALGEGYYIHTHAGRGRG